MGTPLGRSALRGRRRHRARRLRGSWGRRRFARRRGSSRGYLVARCFRRRLRARWGRRVLVVWVIVLVLPAVLDGLLVPIGVLMPMDRHPPGDNRRTMAAILPQ